MTTLTDEQFFADYPDRNFRIREPFHKEYRREFKSLGLHLEHRRRVLVWRMPAREGAERVNLMPIPFLLRSDEAVADDDKVLGALMHEIMSDAGKKYGVHPRWQSND